MVSLRRTGLVVMGALAVAACSSSSSTSGQGDGGGEDGSGGGSDAASEGSVMSDGGGEAGPTSQDASDGASSTGDAGDGGSVLVDASDAPSDAPPCPDVHGAYTITAVQGQGCGTSFDMSAPECVVQAPLPTCDISFASSSDAGSAINGRASLQNDGSFSGAAITEGTLGRTGCTGVWMAGSSTLRVDCGGVDSGQACVLDLVRAASSCP
jgi:hypothetical protein